MKPKAMLIWVVVACLFVGLAYLLSQALAGGDESVPETSPPSSPSMASADSPSDLVSPPDDGEDAEVATKAHELACPVSNPELLDRVVLFEQLYLSDEVARENGFHDRIGALMTPELFASVYLDDLRDEVGEELDTVQTVRVEQPECSVVLILDETTGKLHASAPVHIIRTQDGEVLLDFVIWHDSWWESRGDIWLATSVAVGAS